MEYYRQVIFPATMARVLKNTFAFLFPIILKWGLGVRQFLILKLYICVYFFKMNKILSLLITLSILSSCNFFKKSPKSANKLIDENIKMMDADKAFSKLSEDKGMKTAFMEYIDSNGVLLRPNQLPIVGANAIDYLSMQLDTEYTLVWEPKGGGIAQSGDLGYTYGVYKMQPKTIDSIMYGTYVSIWKKQNDGSWRFVLNSGNEGLNINE